MELLPGKIERERDILWMFDFALLMKAINGGLEVLVALLILVTPPSVVLTLVELVTGGELSRDPDDPIANALATAAHSLTVHTPYVLMLYLALHGVVKIALVVGIFAGKRIAYPLFMLALIIFGTYEAYRGTMRHEILLQVFAAFDFGLLALTAYEYERRYGPLRLQTQGIA